MLRAMELQTATSQPHALTAVAAAILLAQNDATAPTSGNDAVAPVATFDILEFRVQGVTLLPAEDIERAVYPFMGKQKTLQDVEQARQAIEQVYREAGYPTGIASIPEQDIKNGIVRLQVTEARIGRVKVSGSHYYSPRNIRQALPALAQGNVPHLPAIQAELERLNTLTGDRSVVPVMKAGREPGTLDVELKVKDQAPLHGRLEANNRSTETTTESRALVAFSYDNLWQSQHSFGLTFQTSPENTGESEFYVITYSLPLSADNERLTIYNVTSNSDVAAGGNFSVVGKGSITGIRANLTLARYQDLFHSLSFGADYKDFEDALLLQGSDTGTTPIQYMPFSVRYDAALRASQSLLRLGLGTTWAFRSFQSDQQEFDDKRAFAQSNFFYINADATYQYEYSSGSRLSGRFATQWTDQALISNEQFGVGGAQSVRGYYESQALGDRGIVASLEWQTKNLAASSWLNESRWHVFYDVGRVIINNPLPDQADDFSMAGAGIGYRLTAWKQLRGELDAGYALRTLGEIKEGDIRLHARLAYEF